MKTIIKVLKFIYSLYGVLLFLLLMLFVIPFALLTVFLDNRRGGILIYTACKVWAIIWYTLLGIRYKMTELGTHDKKNAYIFVANHNSYLDIPQLMRSLSQPVRVLGKAELAKVPLFGIIYRAAVVSVDRGSLRSKAASMIALRKIIKEGISIFIFPEGGFNETQEPLAKFYDGAFRIAIESQTPIKPLLFLDTAARIPQESIFQMTPGKCRSILLPEISVEGYSLKDIQSLKEKVFSEMQKALTEYKK